MYFIIQFTYIYIFSLAIFRLLIFLIISFEKLFFVRITFGKIKYGIMGEKTRTNQEKDSSLPVKIISPNICFQILQLQMNDYKYHYLFTTFVSTLGPRKWMERGSTRLENDPSLCSRISRPSTSRTSSTISSISLPSVWSTRRTSVCGVSWGTWSDISRPGIRFSTNRELYRWVKNFRVIENLFFPVETDVERSSRDVCAICYCIPSDIFKRDRFIYIYIWGIGFHD